MSTILSDVETLNLLEAFYAEALRFLGVPRNKWAVVRSGISIGQDGKAFVSPHIDYANGRIIVCMPFIRLYY